MGIFTQIFGKKKPQQDPSKGVAANNRDGNNRIASELREASRYANAMGPEYLEMTERLRDSILNADPVSANDASEIDALLTEVIKEYRKGLKAKHEETAREGQMIIKTGLLMRKGLQNCDEEEKAKNEEKLGLWLAYLQRVEAHAGNLEELERLENECAKLRDALSEKYENILEETKTNPAWETLKTLRPSDTAPAAAQDLFIKIRQYILDSNLYLIAGSTYRDTKNLISNEASVIQALKNQLESNLQLVDGTGDLLVKIFNENQSESQAVKEELEKTDDAITDMVNAVKVREAGATQDIISGVRKFQNVMAEQIHEQEQRAKMLEKREREQENEKQEQLLNG